ncbi:hypothetical protein [Clostridium sp.]|uniref:hypothetical protein n=1 Tax=Clostridium sp. TaxID=1506 RepID=UPI001A435605|nr:hypothetical protein [Clostridium sp.]MBK5235281.1 hypothetical protein [Clostridium sp.]
MNKIYKFISIVALASFLISTISYAKDKADKTGEIINVAPYAGLSATVVHPKKLDLVLMTDYTGSKKSNLVSSVNATVSSLFGKNVDAKVYTEDTSNGYHVGDTYAQQIWDGSPSDTGTGPTSYDGSESARVDIGYGTTVPNYKRILHSGFGKMTWNNDDTISFAYNNPTDYFNTMGESPPLGGTIWSSGNVKQIGASKHALYILTTDGILYMSGNATQMCGSYGNSMWNSHATPYTGMRQVMTGVADIESNYNGIGVLMTNGTVKYSGNLGLLTYNYYQRYYKPAMNIPYTTSSSSYMYSIDNYLVSSGFQTIPGMSNITRISLGTQSIIGMNDTTGKCYGIGYNQGQFGWSEPYYMAYTGMNASGERTAPATLNTTIIPLLDSREIKQMYMYGVYTKIIKKDNTIWRLKGGGFTTHSPYTYMFGYINHSLLSIEPGSYTRVGVMDSTDLFDIDTRPSFSQTGTSGTTSLYRAWTGYVWLDDVTQHYDYNISSTSSVTAKADSTAITKYGATWYTNYNFSGIHPVYSLNTEDVVNKTYRAEADRILLYVSDNTSKDFASNDFGSYYPLLGLKHNFMSFLSSNNYANYIVTPSSMLDYMDTTVINKQEISLKTLSNSTQDGHLYDTGNYAQALTDILTKYSNNKEDFVKYVIVDEDVLQYNTSFNDREKDIKKSERWMYTHDPTFFSNSTGTLSTSGQWVSSPITKFTKTGEYKTTYQVQDKPTNDSDFSDYDKWSEQSNQLDIFAHRRPIAKFKAVIPSETISTTSLITDFNGENDIPVSYNSYCNIQTGGYGGSNALKGTTVGTSGQDGSATVTLNVPANASNAVFKYIATGNQNYTVTIDGTTSERSGNINSVVSLILSPGVHTLVIASYYTAPYSRHHGEDDYAAIFGTFTLDNLELTYNTSTWTNGSASDYTGSPLRTTVRYSDSSYDIDHTLTSNTSKILKPLPDKGIQAEEWKWIETTPGVLGTWQSGKPATVLKYHLYQVSLRVQDLEGAWSYPYIISLGGEVLETNDSPTANFFLNTNVMMLGTTNNITDTAPYNDYDPDGDPIVEKSWAILTLDGYGNISKTQNYGSTKPNLSTLLSGSYILTKKVRDDPSARGSYLTSSWSALRLVEFSVIDYTLTGQVNHTSEWNINRIKYNRAKTGTDDSPRTYDVFFPGENFSLLAFTTPGGNALDVTVSIEGTTFSTNLVQTASATWTGDLWDESMINWPNKTVKFKFKATYPYGITKTYDVYIKIDGGGGYWLQHREF